MTALHLKTVYECNYCRGEIVREYHIVHGDELPHTAVECPHCHKLHILTPPSIGELFIKSQVVEGT